MRDQKLEIINKFNNLRDKLKLFEFLPYQLSARRNLELVI